MFIKNGMEQQGSWPSPRQIILIDVDGGFLNVLCRAGKIVCASVEDVIAAADQNELTCAFKDSVYDLEANLVSNINGVIYRIPTTDRNAVSDDCNAGNDKHPCNFRIKSGVADVDTNLTKTLPETENMFTVSWI